MPRRSLILVSDLEPGMIVSGHVHACAPCGTLFVASADTLYCCNACRVRAYRAKENPPA